LRVAVGGAAPQPLALRSVVGSLLDLEGAQAKTAEQHLQRSAYSADAVATFSRTQHDRERDHPSFIAERQNQCRYL
jgi:hypothetical protein